MYSSCTSKAHTCCWVYSIKNKCSTSSCWWNKWIITASLLSQLIKFFSVETISLHSPFEFVVGSWWEGGAFDDFPHLLATEAEVVDGPHVGELHHFDLGRKTREWATPDLFIYIFIYSIQVRGAWSAWTSKPHIKTAFHLNKHWQQTGRREERVLQKPHQEKQQFCEYTEEMKTKKKNIIINEILYLLCS